MELYKIYLIGNTPLIAGVILYVFPPKKMNALYGYRTSRSMKSQEFWDYGQRLGGRALIILGLIINAALFGTPFLMTHKSVGILMFILLVGGSIVMIIVTKLILKKKEKEFEGK